MNFFRDSGHSSNLHAIRLKNISVSVIACGIFLILIAGVVSNASAETAGNYPMNLPFQGATGGKAIFDEKCAGCHTVGNGKLVGPDLQDVTNRRDPAWLKNFLLDTPGMLASDAVAQELLKEYNNVAMPNMGLTVEQVDQLIEFLGDPSAVSAAQAPVLPPGAGDPVVGRKLFTGEQKLANGGPHCIACHSVSGTGSLGGGGLGPDLTEVYQRYGEPGLFGVFKTITFPTMVGPFQNRPLTTQEQADLVAFFRDSDRWQPQVSVISAGALSVEALLVFGIGLVSAGLLFGLLWFFWLRIKKNNAPHLPIRKV